MPDADSQFLMSVTLQVAVPQWLAHLDMIRRDGILDADAKAAEWANRAADEVAHRGDVLQFGGKPGEAAAVMNHLARGIAALATAPGGVRFLGMIYCAKHWPGGRPAGESPSCDACLFEPRTIAPPPIVDPVGESRRRLVNTLHADGRHL